MPKAKNKAYSIQDDYDSPWKEALEIYFTDFMTFFFPEIAHEIDWPRGYKFRDKEFQRIVRDASLGRRYADKLVSVWSTQGEEINVMVHIEIQAARDNDFPERMYVYNYRIYDKYHKPVTSLAILADAETKWHPQKFTRAQWGCSVDFQFPTVKLKPMGKDMDALLAQANPFAMITAAHLMTQASKHDPQIRYAWKWKLTRMLYERDFTREQILNLYRFIDWLMALPELLSKEFNTQHKAYEEDKKMPYITTAERIGREEGLEEGLEKGMLAEAREMVLEALDIKFRTVPGDMQGIINALNNRVLLKKLHRSAIQSKDIQEFRKIIRGIDPEK